MRMVNKGIVETEIMFTGSWLELNKVDLQVAFDLDDTCEFWHWRLNDSGMHFIMILYTINNPIEQKSDGERVISHKKTIRITEATLSTITTVSLLPLFIVERTKILFDKRVGKTPVSIGEFLIQPRNKIGHSTNQCIASQHRPVISPEYTRAVPDVSNVTDDVTRVECGVGVRGRASREAGAQNLCGAVEIRARSFPSALDSGIIAAEQHYLAVSEVVSSPALQYPDYAATRI
ncbi:hypothetical protein C8J56DRAFT_892050 [Mycena floridula]|nr:hypothetical protein C8J56DRAFT_892050 [Mycena floridula]